MQQTRGRSASPPRPDPWRRIDSAVGWPDLVAPPAAVATLQSIPALLSERYWTASAPGVGGRRGVLALFAGSGGTGKTLAAQVLAHELGVAILRVDLEAMFAEGRGEAARLMARLFATAQQLGAVLELDRAQFALSTAVAAQRPMSVRAAGVDLRELFARCESHPGVVVFPTGHLREIDPATRARFDATVALPFPEAAARVQIWRRALPAGSTLSATELTELAGAFALPGAAIASSCATADRLAAADGAAVALRHVARALEQEYETRLVSEHTRAALAALHDRVSGVLAPTSAPAAVAGPEPVAKPEPIAEPEPIAKAAPIAVPDPVVAPQPVPEPEPMVAPEPAPEPEPVAEPEPSVATELSPPSPVFADLLAAAVADEPEPASAPEPEPEPDVPPPRAQPDAPAAAAPQHAAAAPGVGLDAIDDDAADGLVRAMAASAVAPETQPARAPRTRLSRGARRVLPIALIGAASAIGLGLAAAHQRHKSTPPAPAATTQLLATRGLRLHYPTGWTRMTAPRLAGLDLRDAVAVASSTPPRGRLVVGLGAPARGNPLPANFIAAHLTGTPTPQQVSLGALRFYRVVDPKLALGAASENVYATATAAGRAIAICQTASQAFAVACERSLATLQVTAASPVPASTAPRPSRAYAAALGSVLARLDRGRTSAAHDLAVARTAQAQAAAAGLLAGLHARASAEVAALHAGSAASANSGLARALRALADAYGTLGRGALHGDARGYRAGQAAVARAASGLTAALARLTALGYDVR